jgi:hypothetical protein
VMFATTALTTMKKRYQLIKQIPQDRVTWNPEHVTTTSDPNNPKTRNPNATKIPGWRSSLYPTGKSLAYKWNFFS